MKANVKSWIILFLSLSVSSITFGQDLAQTFELGNRANQNGDYEQAIAYYTRVLFFDKEQKYTQSILENLAASHFSLENYESSAYYYDIAYNLISDEPNQSNQLLLKRALCYIYLEAYTSALMDLYLVERPTSDIARQAYLLEGVCHYRMGKFEEAQFAFENSFNAPQDSMLLANHLEKLAKINRKSPKKARIFSIIVPGSGLMYVGDWKQGINSFVLVGGLATLMLVNTVNTGFVNAFFNVFPWYQRYYMGGYILSERVAERKLDTKRLKLLKNIIDDAKYINTTQNRSGL